MLPIAVDAMGGDHAPESVIEGAEAAAGLGISVVLVGDPGRVRSDVVPVAAAGEVIGMGDEPAQAVRRKKDASVTRAAEMVRDGAASGFVGLGNTGATMAAALLRIGRIGGVRRPAVAAIVPAPGTTRRTVVLDVGANVDCTPAMLDQFARMGAAYARVRFGVDRPTVALLSIGEEAGKGNDLVREAAALLASDRFASDAGASFLGNVEGRDLIAGVADVVVTDGFTGNVALKTLEGTSRWVSRLLRDRLEAAASLTEESWEELDPDTYNGAILLGIRGVCVIGHGSSSPRAVCRAIQAARDLAAEGVIEQVRAALGVPHEAT